MTLATQRVENYFHATKINAYWLERGIEANARIELLEINIKRLLNNFKGAQSWEIVSDLAGRESPRLGL